MFNIRTRVYTGGAAARYGKIPKCPVLITAIKFTPMAKH